MEKACYLSQGRFLSMEGISKALVFKVHDQNLMWKKACSLSQGKILNMEGISKALVFKNRDQNLI
jgi:hypothetical protein